MDEEARAALAAKGYDFVDAGFEQASDSDDDGGMPGRIPALPPNEAREKGKKAFEQGKYDKAIKCWQGGLKSILSSLCSGPAALGDQSLSELDLTLNLNIAMAYMKKGEYDSADRSVDKALARRDALPDHLVGKALYRKASAQRAMRRLDECLETLKDLLQVEPDQAAAKQMKQEVEREWQKQCRDQKNNFAKIFAKLGDEDRKQTDLLRKKRTEARSSCGVRWLANDDVDTAAFELGNAPGCDGKDWGLGFSRTLLWSIEQLAVEGAPCISTNSVEVSMWFLGVSSTCELRFLQPKTLLARLPSVMSLELVLIGYLGEYDPNNKRIPDAKADSLPSDGSAELEPGVRVTIRHFHGTLNEFLNVSAATAAVGQEQGAEAPAAIADEAAPPISPAESARGDVKLPTICFIAHPQLHRYFTDFFPALNWLVENKVPTIVIGASEPDHSWRQDEVLLKAAGAQLVVKKTISPYPMCLPDNDKIRKCNHIIGFQGGKPVDKENLTKVKLDLLAQDYSVR